MSQPVSIRLLIARPDMAEPRDWDGAPLAGTPAGSEPAPVPVAAVVRTLAAQVVELGLSGAMVGREQRRARAAACGACRLRGETGLRGLWGCQVCPCGLAELRPLHMVLPASRCSLGRW